MVKFYKDGDRMGIEADCPTKEMFIQQAAAELGKIIENSKFANDWEFQLERWLPQICDIASSYGELNLYSVVKTTVLKCGIIENEYARVI